ncbi:TPA: ERF family protein, partial [Pseudomonas aeruginosa]|nr:ERF family protein [Pseudomonas aeruginosa]
RIDEAKDKDELAAIWKAAVGVLRAAGDTTGYERVKAAAAERGKALEGTEK